MHSTLYHINSCMSSENYKPAGNQPQRKRRKTVASNGDSTNVPQYLKGNVLSSVLNNNLESFEGKELWVIQLPKDVSFACSSYSVSSLLA